MAVETLRDQEVLLTETLSAERGTARWCFALSRGLAVAALTALIYEDTGAAAVATAVTACLDLMSRYSFREVHRLSQSLDRLRSSAQ